MLVCIATCDNANQSMSACGLKVLCGTHLLVKNFRLALRLLQSVRQYSGQLLLYTTVFIHMLYSGIQSYCTIMPGRAKPVYLEAEQ